MHENIILEAIRTTPPITRILISLVLLTSLSVYLQVISPYQLMINFNNIKIINILTSLFYFGPPTLDTILSIIFVFRYSRMLEESFIYTSDYFYFLFIIFTAILIVSFSFKIVLLGPILSSVITYVWTKKNPYAQLQMLGFIVFPAFYLPFIIPILTFLGERRVLINEVAGICIGHVYYFFKFVFPVFGYDIFKTPKFIKHIFNEVENKNRTE